MIGIYKITNPKGKVYIGQSINIHNRKKNYELFNCHQQPKIYNSLKKYGWEQHIFEVIEECSLEQLNEREMYWGRYYNVLGNNGLNLKLGNGRGSCSEETKQKMKKPKSEQHKINLKKPKIWSKEGKERLIKSRTGNKNKLGKKHTKEAKERIGYFTKIRFMGGIQSEETRLKRSNSLKGRIHSEESNKKRSESLKGRLVTDERKIKTSKSMLGKRYKPVLQFDKQGNFIKEWDGPTTIELELGIKSVGQVCNNKLKSSGGFIWKWK